MAIKYPRLCMGIVVTGTATIRTSLNTVATSVTIPEGTYWGDPVYAGHKASDTISAIGKLAERIEADGTDAGTYTPALDLADDEIQMYPHWSTITRSANTMAILAAEAQNTTPGRRFLRFLGWDPLTNQSASQSIAAQYTGTVWDPIRGEDGSPEETPDPHAETVLSNAGRAFGFSLGQPAITRVVSLPALSAEIVKRRLGTVTSTGHVVTWDFETLMWPWLRAGQPCRLYADRTVTATYLTSALTSTGVSAAVASGTGIANGDVICINGEWVQVVSGGGTTTLVILRDDPAPVSHPKYAPVSQDMVATYVLDQRDGGLQFKDIATRRGAGDDRWDFKLPLLRTSWT